ncbi:MAG: hypothetical protein F6K41_38300 [Symploca sp. SIO3E6]|nr:hypothetical protein [Caldora sp. SIO3E6]
MSTIAQNSPVVICLLNNLAIARFCLPETPLVHLLQNQCLTALTCQL